MCIINMKIGTTFIEWAVLANFFYKIIELDFVIWGDEECNVLFMYIPSFQSSDIDIDEIVVYHNL